MATIIDSLVIELGLDTKRFTELQKKAIDDLKRLEDAGVRHGQRVERHVATGLQSLVRFIENPIAAARRHLETLAQPAQRSAQQLQNLGAQGRRSGTDVEAGALAGAAGLRVLGGAGLLAWASLTAVNKVMSAVHENAQKTFGASVGASGAGLGIGRYTAISQALFQARNVPQEQTQGWLTQFGQQQRHWQNFGGVPNEVSSSLFATGSTINTPIQQILRNFARWAQRFDNSPESDRTITNRGGYLGITPEMALALKQLGPRGFDSAVAEAERKTALNKQDEQTSKDLLAKYNDMINNLDRLNTTIFNNLTPVLSGLIDGINKLIEWARWWSTGPDTGEKTAPIPPRVGTTRSGTNARGQREWTASIPRRPASNDDLQSGPFGSSGGSALGGHIRDPRGLVPYIREGAAARGINPDMAVAVARSEGLGKFLGDGGKSGGAFQLYTGGGLGNTFQRDKHLDPLDPKNEKATIDYALDHIARNGWGPWHGARRIGITGMMGIGGKLMRIAPESVTDGSNRASIPATGGSKKIAVATENGIRMMSYEERDEYLKKVGHFGKKREQSGSLDPTGAMRYGDVQPPHRTLQASFGDITIHTAATNARDIADEFRERVRQNLAVANLNTGFV